MDYKLAALVEKYQQSKLRGAGADEFDSDSDDDLLDALENDDSYSKYREQRMQALSEEFKNVNRLDQNSMGKLQTIQNEKELMDLVTNSERVIIHFQKPEFQRCRIMNRKLEILAEKHLTVKFLSIDVTDASFLVDKLNIKVLPFVVGYINGKETFRNIGFNNLGEDPNDFKVEAMEKLLILGGILNRSSSNFRTIQVKQNHGRNNNYNDDDSDSGLDI